MRDGNYCYLASWLGDDDDSAVNFGDKFYSELELVEFASASYCSELTYEQIEFLESAYEIDRLDFNGPLPFYGIVFLDFLGLRPYKKVNN